MRPQHYLVICVVAALASAAAMVASARADDADALTSAAINEPRLENNRQATAPARFLTWTDARRLAVQHAPELALAATRVDAARADVTSAGALVNPTLTFLTARQTAKLGASISQPLPLFGQRATQIAAAEADASAATLDRDVARLDARWAAALAWVDLWETKQRADLLAAAATDAKRLSDIARERFAAGAAPRLDVVHSRADEGRADAEARAGLTLIDAAAAKLTYFVGASSAPPRARGEPLLPDDPRVYDETLATHPLLARDDAAITAAAAHMRAERRQRAPVIAGELTINVGDPTLDGTDVIGGVAFEAPVLNLRGGPIARARAQVALAEATRALDVTRIGADRADARDRYQSARGRVEAFRARVLPALLETRALTEESYRSGRSDLVRLLEAQRALIDARLTLVEATATAARALADLEHACGVSNEPALTKNQ